jgi:glycosyltransferase involved in cell wall biosynthesis
MLIGIDANEANVLSRVGISEYAYQVLLKLYELRKNDKIKHSFVIYLKAAPLSALPPSTSWWQYKIIKPAKLWTQIGLPLHLLVTSKKPDVVLSLTHYAPRFTTVPTVVSIMDLSFIHFPETFKSNDLYQLKNWTKYSVKNAAKVITISQSSKDDIIKYYKVKAQNIKVVHLGLKELSMTTVSKDLQEFGVNKKYILFVGTLQPRKNIVSLIKAFSLLPQELKDSHQLVIIGKKGWLYEDILKAPSTWGVEDKVLFLDYISDNDLPQFYKKAEVFVLPSLYEGFGLPILEAMRFGCPVITSNVSSLPEAGGNAALYFDPENIEDIESTIEKVLTDDKVRESMIEKGHEHYKKFTWEKAAKEVLEVLEEV